MEAVCARESVGVEEVSGMTSPRCCPHPGINLATLPGAGRVGNEGAKGTVGGWWEFYRCGVGRAACFVRR